MKPRYTLFFLLLFTPLRADTASSASIQIEALVTETVTRNPELRFYREAISAARADAKLAAKLPDPELALDYGHKRVHNGSNQLAAEGTAWSVAVTQTFEWPGRLSLRKAIANHEVELAKLGLARFERALAARTRTLAYGLHAAQAKATAIREVADRFADLKATFLARDPAGITPVLETRVIEAAELGLQRRATEAELEVQAALLELNQLRGAAIDAPLRVAAPALQFGPIPDQAALLEAAHANNFDFAMRRVELEQQGMAVNLARSRGRPGLSVSPFYSQEKAGDRETVVGLGLSIPLPMPGRTGATVTAAESRRRQAEAALFTARRELNRKVLTIAQAYRTKVAEIQRWSPDTIEQFRAAAELADRHYRLGAVQVATYTELQSSYLDATEALLDTQGEALVAGLELQELTGLDFNPVTLKP